jgi:hypothetical protein
MRLPIDSTISSVGKAAAQRHKPLQQHKHKSQLKGASDSRSGDEDGPNARSRTKVRRTQATSARVSEIVKRGLY